MSSLDGNQVSSTVPDASSTLPASPVGTDGGSSTRSSEVSGSTTGVEGSEKLFCASKATT